MWEKIKRVIEHSQDIDNPNVDYLAEQWQVNKRRFVAKMGGPIYETEEVITFPLDPASRADKINNLIDFCLNYDRDVADFLSMNADGLLENKTIEEYVTKHGDVIPPGMKIGKALNRFFVEYADEELIESIQLSLSRIIQENKISGKLCISVHPLDYLSMSENQHNWRSCHALDGEYRSGNLSYMMDDCTIIAYLKSEEDCYLPRFPMDVPWNNKKWRCLFYIDRENKLVWAGRQYPMNLGTSALNAVTALLDKFHFFEDGLPLGNNLWRSHWEPVVQAGGVSVNGHNFYVNPTVFLRNHARPIKHYVKDVKDPLHFNDLLRSSCYMPWAYIYGYKSDSAPVKAMMVGHEVHCLCCGEGVVETSETMMCNDCLLENTDFTDGELIGTCTHCGCRIVLSSATASMGEYYCEACAEEVLVTCDRCGTTFNQYNRDEGIITPDGPLCWQCRP